MDERRIRMLILHGAIVLFLGLLAGMIIIRTILSWTTFLEISGRWPWKKTKGSPSSTT